MSLGTKYPKVLPHRKVELLLGRVWTAYMARYIPLRVLNSYYLQAEQLLLAEELDDRSIAAKAGTSTIYYIKYLLLQGFVCWTAVE